MHIIKCHFVAFHFPLPGLVEDIYLKKLLFEMAAGTSQPLALYYHCPQMSNWTRVKEWKAISQLAYNVPVPVRSKKTPTFPLLLSNKPQVVVVLSKDLISLSSVQDKKRESLN